MVGVALTVKYGQGLAALHLTVLSIVRKLYVSVQEGLPAISGRLIVVVSVEVKGTVVVVAAIARASNHSIRRAV